MEDKEEQTSNNYLVCGKPYEAGPYPEKKAPPDFILVENIAPGYPLESITPNNYSTGLF